jgi:hypothetical protein
MLVLKQGNPAQTNSCCFEDTLIHAIRVVEPPNARPFSIKRLFQSVEAGAGCQAVGTCMKFNQLKEWMNDAYYPTRPNIQ